MNSFYDYLGSIIAGIDSSPFPVQIVMFAILTALIVLSTSLSPIRFARPRIAIAAAVAAAGIWHGRQFGIMTAILLALLAVILFAEEMGSTRSNPPLSKVAPLKKRP